MKDDELSGDTEGLEALGFCRNCGKPIARRWIETFKAYAKVCSVCGYQNLMRFLNESDEEETKK